MLLGMEIKEKQMKKKQQIKNAWDIKKIKIGTESDAWLKAEVFNSDELRLGKFSLWASENTGEGQDVFCSAGNSEKAQKRYTNVSIEDMPLGFAIRLRDFLNYAIPNPTIHAHATERSV